jgi:hypothetical protein
MTPYEARLVRLSAWSCFLFIVLFGLFWGVLGRNIPPYPPDMPAEDLAAVYRAHASTLRIGFSVGAVSCALLATWAIGLFRIMLKIEHGGQILSYVQLVGGVLTVIFTTYTCTILLAAAFRPEQDPSQIRMLFDLAWITLDLGFGVTTMQYLAFGAVALRDHREKPLFPKWLAWLGIWVSLEFLVEIIMPYFRTGPFSWYGMFPYWLAFFGPFAWMTSVAIWMLKAANRLEAEYETEDAPLAPRPLTTS